MAARKIAAERSIGAWPRSWAQDALKPRSLTMQAELTVRMNWAVHVQPSSPIALPGAHLPSLGMEYQLPTSSLVLHWPCTAPLPKPMA
eukprot:CAMPEP_0171092336 /NCGR_PEP_ID=MMETSP0766_2-20121228/35628_1 /TAXON_ID=439317 /ORGANISM="Gambierdiscus australes, Strain CAWD 149" /LENGTH=87 /DNA_ID=CAMNT_0011550555 /DNA_START=120 /DNA_END=379 /DNA_ORIENTATION=-